MNATRPVSIATLALTILVASIAGFPAAARAQSPHTPNTLKLDDPGARPPARIEDVAWLAGTWEGEGFGGTFVETWGEPSGGTMVGMYRLMHEGETTLYEIELIAEEAGSLVLKVKHFDPDFSAWEEKDEYVTFPLVKLSDDAVYFHGFTLRRRDDRTLDGYIAVTRGDELGENELTYRRVVRRR